MDTLSEYISSKIHVNTYEIQTSRSYLAKKYLHASITDKSVAFRDAITTTTTTKLLIPNNAKVGAKLTE